MPNKDKEYFQVIFDRTKEHEKKYIDVLDDLMNNQGMKKKDILMLVLDKIQQEKSLKDAVKEGNKEVIEEIKDLKLMVKAIASGNIAFTVDEIPKEEVETIEIDISDTSEDHLTFYHIAMA